MTQYLQSVVMKIVNCDEFDGDFTIGLMVSAIAAVIVTILMTIMILMIIMTMIIMIGLMI